MAPGMPPLAPEPSPLCANSFDFTGTDPPLWCGLSRGRGGRWNTKRGVGWWTLDDETFQSLDPETATCQGGDAPATMATSMRPHI